MRTAYICIIVCGLAMTSDTRYGIVLLTFIDTVWYVLISIPFFNWITD